MIQITKENFDNAESFESFSNYFESAQKALATASIYLGSHKIFPHRRIILNLIDSLREFEIKEGKENED